MSQNDIGTGMPLQINGKLFVPPANDGADFKETFRKLAMEGAGRTVDKTGVPSGPWTPETLFAELNKIANDRGGIELRTVQRWFADNDQGIRAENIGLLSKVFGCGDPDKTILWQVALTAAQSRQQARRRGRPASKPETRETSPQAVGSSLPTRDAPFVERLVLRVFRSENPLTVPVMLWFGFTVLGFMSYIFNVETITYVSEAGSDKQVGFLWAPSWTIFPTIILPLYVVIIARIVALSSDTMLLPPWQAPSKSSDLLSSYSGLLWLITITCFFVIFLLQWSGVHLRALLSRSPHGYMIDWNNVAIVRPDIVSISNALTLSFTAYLYYAIVMWLLLVGLVLQVASASKYRTQTDAWCEAANDDHRIPIEKRTILTYAFCATILALLSVITIKLQSTYLITSAPTLSSWLLSDAASFLNGIEPAYQFLHQRSIPQLTTLIIVFAIILSFYISLYHMGNCGEPLRNGVQSEGRRAIPLYRYAIIVLLAANVITIGRFQGFSLYLALTSVISILDLLRSIYFEAERP
ncbi:hypothetical protein [Gemmobacter serpentinus]|uniref:hypothetical protein n=1 Tax=Gemmobacter serpentinus TaxID=2652247 RepID=UPI00124C696D|nr:hypothetical protein [Gemmobacter serpentinus]